MDLQPIIDWFNAWPVDTKVLEWVSPRIIILGTIIYVLKIIAKLTPWAWDNVLVASIDSVFGRFTKNPPGNKKNDRPADQPEKVI